MRARLHASISESLSSGPRPPSVAATCTEREPRPAALPARHASAGTPPVAGGACWLGAHPMRGMRRMRERARVCARANVPCVANRDACLPLSVSGHEDSIDIWAAFGYG